MSFIFQSILFNMLLKQNVMIFRLSRSHWTNSESPDSVFVGVLVVAAHACDYVIAAQPQVQVLKSDFTILEGFFSSR